MFEVLLLVMGHQKATIEQNNFLIRSFSVKTSVKLLGTSDK